MNWVMTHWWQLGIVFAFLIVACFLLMNIHAYENRTGPDHPPPPPTPTSKDEKREPRRWDIPKENIEEILGLLDDYKDEDHTLARYRFWNKLAEIIPETRDLEVIFEPDENVLAPYVKEVV